MIEMVDEQESEPVAGEAEAEAGAVSGAMVEALVDLRREQDRLDAELKAIKEQSAALSEQLLEQFLSAGVSSVKSASGATVYMQHKQFYGVAVLDGEEKQEAEMRVAEMLEDAGLAVLVQRKVALNLKGLAEHLAEQRETGMDADERLEQAYKVVDDFSIRVRRN